MSSHKLMQFVAFSVCSVLLALAPLHAQTQPSMNAQAPMEFQRADADLNKTYQSIFTKLPTAESKQKLREVQRAWVISRDAEAARAAKETEGGSMAPTLHYQTMTNLTRERITELKAMVDTGSASGPQTEASQSQHNQVSSVSHVEPGQRAPADSISPDKKWEYKCVEYSAGDCLPQIVKTGTTQRVVDLNDVPDGARGMGAEILWAPDSKRFAFNYSAPLTHHSYETVAFYQLHDDKWEALRSLADGLANEAYPRQCDANQGNWQLRNWTDRNTAILYAGCSGRVESAFLFTLKFDDAGNWKIVKTHRMSEKEVKEHQ
jgi:uncharacterized protein YecT (DUF1311 family)